jgi:hypothetical protein
VSPCPAHLQMLPQPVGPDQHILRISKLLLPLEIAVLRMGLSASPSALISEAIRSDGEGYPDDSNRLPNFFISGAPKAGTTWLYQYLDQHPEIFMSAMKSRTSLWLRSVRSIVIPSPAVGWPREPWFARFPLLVLRKNNRRSCCHLQQIFMLQSA